MLEGEGTIQGNVKLNGVLNSYGDITDPIGHLNVQGNVTLGSSATLSMDVTGLSTYDVLTVSDTLNLAGTLLIIESNNYQVPRGAAFRLIQYNRVTGSFGTIRIFDPTSSSLPTSRKLTGGSCK